MKKVKIYAAMFFISIGYLHAQNNTFPTTGNVGIGTTSPAYKLDVQGGAINITNAANYFYKVTPYVTIGNSAYGSFPYISFNAQLTTSDAANSINSFTPAYNPGGGLIIKGDAGNSGLHFLQKNYNNGTSPYNMTSFTEALTLSTSGNIGIGTTAPAQKLDVAGNIAVSGKIYLGSVNVNNTGTHLLAVNGSAIFTKVVVKLNTDWPDYVFEPQYKLPSLESIEAFINVNKHLPDIPSAEEIAKNGIDLGENQTLMLKKIEELTLYIISQEKLIKELQNKLEQQGTAIYELKKKIE